VNSGWLTADWPAPPQVRTCVTTREGGTSVAPWAGLNLGSHVGDDPAAVSANRTVLMDALGCMPAWLEQTHGTSVVAADPTQVINADASWTDQPGIACTIMTADCLPVLFCDRAGTRVAAAHAGWRGLASGILENTIAALRVPPGELLVWLGPAIGPAAFEVGEEVRQTFVDHDPVAVQAFRPSGREGHYLADIYQLARQRLQRAGVNAVWGGGLCTVGDARRFYSYRRDGMTGRFASLIWLAC
jgi:polyphenol oxidase